MKPLDRKRGGICLSNRPRGDAPPCKTILPSTRDFRRFDFRWRPRTLIS
jgi:hypothetical protein